MPFADADECLTDLAELAAPPPEVRAAIADAAEVADRLAEVDRAVRFDVAASGRRVTAVLTDHAGVRLIGLAGREVLAIAGGEL